LAIRCSDLGFVSYRIFFTMDLSKLSSSSYGFETLTDQIEIDYVISTFMRLDAATAATTRRLASPGRSYKRVDRDRASGPSRGMLRLKTSFVFALAPKFPAAIVSTK
jgi:hypothetical protein